MKVKIYKIIIFCVVIMFFADIVNIFIKMSGLNLSRYSFSLYIRGLVFALFTYLMLLKRKGVNYLLLLLLLSSFYLLGILFSYESKSFLVEDVARNIIAIVKIVFIFLCWGAMKYYIDTYRKAKKLFKAYEFIVVIFSLVLVTSFLLNIKIFSAYRINERFGMHGLIPAINETSGFFLLATFYFLNKYFLIERSSRNLFFLIAIVLVSMLVGTKVCLIFIPISALMYFLKYFRTYFSIRKVFTIGAVFLFVFILVYANKNMFIQQIKNTKGYFSGQYQLREKKLGYTSPYKSYLSVILSGRDIKLQNFISEITKSWRGINYFVGGWSYHKYSVEMDFFDLFGLVGGVGTIIYVIMYLNLLFGGNRVNYFFTFFPISAWLLVSFSGGHLIFSAINATYLSIFLIQSRFIMEKFKKCKIERCDA